MPKFVFVYVGGAPAKGQEQENMKAWGDWVADLSQKGIYKSGEPFGWTKKTVNSDNSVTDYLGQNSGYSLIEAGSMEEALEIAKTGPNQKYGGSTDVFDVMEIPGM
jgi:hypothetical protein